MLSIVLTVCLALAALAAGWFECFRKDVPPKTNVLRRVTPVGWCIFTSVVSLAALDAFTTRAEQAYLGRELANANVALSTLRDDAIRTFNDELAIRLWKAETDSVIKAFSLGMNLLIEGLESVSKDVLTLQELESARTHDQASQIYLNNKKASVIIIELFGIGEKTLSTQHKEVVAALNQRGISLTNEANAAINQSLNGLRINFQLLKDGQSELFGITESLARGNVYLFKNATETMALFMELTSEVAYQARLRNLRIVPVAPSVGSLDHSE